MYADTSTEKRKEGVDVGVGPVIVDWTCQVMKKALGELTGSDQTPRWWHVWLGHWCVRSLACWLRRACDPTPRGCVRSCCRASGHDLVIGVESLDRWRTVAHA
jgi:hypothetical protein